MAHPVARLAVQAKMAQREERPMPRTLAVHLTGMAVLAGLTAFTLWAVGPAMPALNRWLAAGVTAAYVAAWFMLAVLPADRRLSPDQARAQRRHRTRMIGWGGAAALVACTWIAGPYVDDQLRLVVVVYQLGAVTMQVMGSIRRPPDRGRPSLVPLVIPTSTALFYAVHWGPYSIAMIVFSVTYSFVAITLRDVLQRAVDRADAQREAAEAALIVVAAERDAKTRFLASASHDLGQPLQAGRLFFDQAMRGFTAAQRAAAADRVTWAFDTMEQLLRQMLDHLRLEAGAVEAHMDTVAIGPLIARIAELNEPAAKLAGVTLLAMPTRLTAMADTSLAERALGNLVANSIRHAKARRVLIGARRSSGKVRLWVIDDGVGVAAADTPRLFDDFVQGSNHGDEVRGGFGLGLASARRIADLMGGGVGLEPRWPHGSAFWLELHAA
jgi:signal transduction histidine kinase